LSEDHTSMCPFSFCLFASKKFISIQKICLWLRIAQLITALPRVYHIGPLFSTPGICGHFLMLQSHFSTINLSGLLLGTL
jgi:hypothetical protein